jgi:MFS family permease
VIPGSFLPAFTILHVVLSLIALVAGLVVTAGFLSSRARPGIAALFLWSILLATLTGLAFPSTRFGMGHKLGFVTALVLLPTFAALYIHRLAGAWRWIYTTGCLTVLWLNGVIGVFQAFAKLDVLRPYAQPAIIDAAQLVLFAICAALALLAVQRFRPALPRFEQWRPAVRW